MFETLPDDLQTIEGQIHDFQSQADMCELRNADDVSLLFNLQDNNIL